MQEFYLIVNWLVAIAMLGLGFVALLKNRNLLLNRVFALFTVTISIWIISAYISNDTANPPSVSIIGNYFVFLFSYISGYLLLWFAVALADDKAALRLVKRLTIPILLIGATTCTPLVVAGVEVQGSVYAVKFGPLAILYFISLVALLVMALHVLRKNIKITKGEQRSNLVILYRSMSIALPILLLTEFILPAITGWFGLTNIGILAMAIPVVGLYYAVVKLKLFNLRLVIVRSLGYLVTLGLISVIYGIVSYYITTLIDSASLPVLAGDAINVLLIVIAITSYAPLKRVFDKITNRFFYRDAYDSQQLYNSMNKLHISTIELNKLLTGSSALIVDYLKIEFCIFSLKAANYINERVVGSGDVKLQHNLVDEVVKLFDKQEQQSVVLNVYDAQIENKILKGLIEQNNIEVIVNLESSIRKSTGSLGYMLLGPKKSGNPYSTQDIRVIDTLAKELVVAIQNAQHFEEIQNFAATLQTRVDEATKKLRRANEKLKELDESKDDFISMASHQLRTPLTSVKGYVSMVLEGDAGKVTKQQKDMLSQAYFSSQRMVYLIADLLNVSRLKTGKFIIEPAPINLATIIDQELSQLQETAASRNLKLNYVRPKNFPDVMLDETKTRQVIMNFVDNAIYYTPSGGHVAVRLTETASTIELRVEDDGIGVAKSDQPHLFTKFYRAGNARKARPDGTGLGLFMAKKVIMAEGGSLIFESAENKGSTFGFVFSKAKVGVGAKSPILTEPTPVIEPSDSAA